jgi:RNA-binding protein 25
MERACTLYVGKIPEGIDDALMVAVLECCGRVSKWKRSSDPSSGKPKGFGFCDYKLSSDLLRAMRLLPTVTTLGAPTPLLLKVDSKASEFLHQYEPEYERYLGHLLKLQALSAEHGVAQHIAAEPILSTADGDAKATESLRALLAQHGLSAGGAAAAAGGVAETGSSSDAPPAAVMRPPPPPQSESAKNASLASALLSMAPGELIALPAGGVHPSPWAGGGGAGAFASGGSGGGSAAVADASAAEAARASSRARERHAREREERERTRDEAFYRSERLREEEAMAAERAWERHEADRERHREREALRERDERRAREREVERDEREPDKALPRERKEERARRMRRERADDDEDRRREANEGRASRPAEVPPPPAGARRPERNLIGDALEAVAETADVAVAGAATAAAAAAATAAAATAAATAAASALLDTALDEGEVLETAPAREATAEAPAAQAEKAAQAAQAEAEEARAEAVARAAAASASVVGAVAPTPMDVDSGAPATAPNGGAPATAPNGGAPATAPNGGAPATAPNGGAPATAPMDVDSGAPATAPNGGAPATAPNGSAAPIKLGALPVKLGGLKPVAKLGAAKKLGGVGVVGAGVAPAAFVVDEGPKMGPLVAIDYTEEEKAAVTPAVAPPTAEELKQLVNSIPTQRDALYAAPIDWDLVGRSGLVEAKLRAFINKKMAEYLGEEEPSLVAHVLDKLAQRTPAAAIEQGLAKVLDEEAGVFVVKLWRMLLFELRLREFEAGRK